MHARCAQGGEAHKAFITKSFSKGRQTDESQVLKPARQDSQGGKDQDKSRKVIPPPRIPGIRLDQVKKSLWIMVGKK